MRFCLHLLLTASLGLAAVAAAEAQTDLRAVTLLNDARSRPRRCGAQTFPAARPLTVSGKLTHAALLHSREMAEHSEMTHEGRDTSTPAERVTREGYAWSAAGENVAAGQKTADAVVAAWLASPGHCANIMNGQYTEMGIASAVNDRDRYGVYWTLSLAAPR